MTDASLEIVNDMAFNVRDAKLVFESLMRRMRPVGFPSFARIKNRRQRDLVRAFDNRTTVCHHATDVKDDDTGDRFEQSVSAGDKRVRGVFFIFLRPENYDVREHAVGITLAGRMINLEKP